MPHLAPSATRTPSRRASTLGRVVLLVLGGALAVACSQGADGNQTGPGQPEEAAAELRFDGPPDGALLGADDLDGLRFAVTTSGGTDLDDIELLLDGAPVRRVERDEGELVYTPTQLDDGERTVTVVSVPEASEDDGTEPDGNPEPEVEPEVLHEWRFTVDTVPPEVELTSPDGAVVAGEAATVAGTTEPDASVTVDGHGVEVAADGSFSLELDDPVARTITVVATDVAGNATEVDVELTVVASRARVETIRSVHVSFYGWAAPSKREPILQMIEDGLINAVQLDIKDEAGEIGYSSEVPLAQEMGASQGIYDLEAAVAELHEMGVPVIGRIVAFADPILANWAWENDARDWVVQTADGEMYVGRYAGFSNPAHEDIREYNIAVAEEAAQLGVDHILWDYIRRPDGELENIVIPGLEGTPEEAIVEFTRMADERLAPYGIEHGASVYGIAGTRPHEIGQDIPGMARHLDYVAPMVYPSHWGPGEYSVDDPNRQPYDIVYASLQSFLDAVEGTRARVVPWLEDTRFRAWDRPFQVREQIRATYDRGIDEWLLWDPWVDYTPDALDPIEP